MLFIKRRMFLILAVCSLVALSACREAEQNRPLEGKKGVYKGPADTKLDDATLQKLRHRGARQSF